jgi:hypothetical protein
MSDITCRIVSKDFELLKSMGRVIHGARRLLVVHSSNSTWDRRSLSSENQERGHLLLAAPMEADAAVAATAAGAAAAAVAAVVQAARGAAPAVLSAPFSLKSDSGRSSEGDVESVAEGAVLVSFHIKDRARALLRWCKRRKGATATILASTAALGLAVVKALLKRK